MNRDSISVQINFALTENLTTSLPALDTVLDLSSPVIAPVQKAFQSVVPNARIEQLNLHARTAQINNRTGLWVFQENYTITVSGVTRDTGGRIVADLAFLSSKNNQSMITSGVELNNVGLTYLLEGFSRFPPDSKTRYFALSAEYTLPLVPEQFTSAFSILDLTWISPVSRWNSVYQPFEPSTMWNLQPRNSPFSVKVGVGLTSEQIFLKQYVAYLNSTVDAIAPPRAQAHGTSIFFDIPTIAETIMPIIIVASLLVTITSILLERRVSKSGRPFRGRKR